MRNLGFLLACLLVAFHAGAQSLKAVDSKITDVTVFLDRAQVTREIKTRIESGKTDLVITGLTSQLDPQSIQLAGKGNFVILGINHQQNYVTELNTPVKLRVLKDSAAYLQKQLVLEQSQKEILNKEEQMLLTNQKIGGTSQNLTVAELRGMADFYRARMSDIVISRMRHDDVISKLNMRIGKIQNQLREQTDLYARNTSEVVVHVSAQVATSVDLDLQYIVANAGWNAVYDLRASNTKSPVQLSYKANVFQGTGEEWNNVNLRLSTANPSLGGTKPELSAWYLDFNHIVNYRKKYDAYGAVHRGAPAAAMAKEEDALPEGPTDAETIAIYTTTVQTSLNTEFVIALPYTVASSSKPTLVDIRQHELKADYRYAVTPKLEADAFLIAKVTGWEEFSLLPGEANVFFEGTFVAKTTIDPNNIKDTLSVSLGRDKRIVVKREKLKDFSSRKAIGANQRDSYAYEISVRNTKNESLKITVEDQIPVSQNSQIEVVLTDAGGARQNSVAGKLTWELTLQPGETKKLVYKFEVKYPKDRIIPAL
jgi:uncharacterized protein (TIGR02231 family)